MQNRRLWAENGNAHYLIFKVDSGGASGECGTFSNRGARKCSPVDCAQSSRHSGVPELLCHFTAVLQGLSVHVPHMTVFCRLLNCSLLCIVPLPDFGGSFSNLRGDSLRDESCRTSVNLQKVTLSS